MMRELVIEKLIFAIMLRFKGLDECAERVKFRRMSDSVLLTKLLEYSKAGYA